MKRLVALLANQWGKQLAGYASGFSLLVLSYLCLVTLHHASLQPERFRGAVSLLLFLFFLPTLLGWVRFGLAGAAFFVPLPILFAILSAWVIQMAPFLVFIPAQLILCGLLFYLDEKNKNELVSRQVQIESAVNEKNDLELAFREKGTSISVLFEKYAGYYNLRNLANDFSATFSLAELCQMVVSKTLEVIPRGERCLLFLADTETRNLSLVASQGVDGQGKIKAEPGDLFDLWILRNRQSLIVTDTEKDFRFDTKKASEKDPVRSLIASPLVHEGKVGGTLRLHSREASSFSTEDLRMLDVIASLASSAVSNALLFHRTEELAIRDSLTGLYVQRHFLERLAEEHRRSLLTDVPMAVLMCDLDHFKTFNDRYGHGVGDLLLIQTARLLSEQAAHGVVSRYGGEEFSILVPKLTLQEARQFAESIRQAVSEMKLEVRRQTISITLSIGVASMPEDTRESGELIRLADQRLYDAKRKGRNRVC